jgi:hypothetical protein
MISRLTSPIAVACALMQGACMLDLDADLRRTDTTDSDGGAESCPEGFVCTPVGQGDAGEPDAAAQDAGFPSWGDAGAADSGEWRPGYDEFGCYWPSSNPYERECPECHFGCPDSGSDGGHIPSSDGGLEGTFDGGEGHDAGSQPGSDGGGGEGPDGGENGFFDAGV